MYNMLTKHRLIFLFLCLSICGAGVWAAAQKFSSTSSQVIAPTVVNKTKALRVEGVTVVAKEPSAHVEIYLVNQSRKHILAYTLSMGHDAITTFSIDVSPDQLITERIPISSLGGTGKETATRTREIVLSAVYLEGGAVEGDEVWTKGLQKRMLAIKEQAKLAVAILRSARDSFGSDSEQLIRDVETRITSLPIQASEGESPESEGGRSWVSSKIKSEMKELRKGKTGAGLDARRRIGDLVTSYEQLIAKL